MGRRFRSRNRVPFHRQPQRLEQDGCAFGSRRAVAGRIVGRHPHQGRQKLLLGRLPVVQEPAQRGMIGRSGHFDSGVGRSGSAGALC